jgi:predicted HD phosphohydrolase
MPIPSPERAAFRALSEATPRDWALIDRAEREHRSSHGPGHGLLAVLECFREIDPMGAPIHLYAHGLQTATRVVEAGEDDELVVVALFHDLAEAFSDNHHGQVAAQMLAPWLSDRRSWLLVHHVELQSVHFANHPTRGPEEREPFRGHPHFSDTAYFCERYDQNSFDPAYPTLPLAAFEPIVMRFFKQMRKPVNRGQNAPL